APTTSAPACASPRAIARPIPDVAPITTAMRPLRSSPRYGTRNNGQRGHRTVALIAMNSAATPPTPELVTFGEAMLRLSPPPLTRLERARHLDAWVGGAELNVAVAAERLGVRTRWV